MVPICSYQIGLVAGYIDVLAAPHPHTALLPVLAQADGGIAVPGERAHNACVREWISYVRYV